MTAQPGTRPDTLALLEQTGVPVQEARRLVDLALDEDLRLGPDVTTEATVPEDLVVTGRVAARAPGVLAGLPFALLVLDTVAGIGTFDVQLAHRDGEALHGGEVIAQVFGPARPLLGAERTMLNLLGHLSGIATHTASWVRAVEDTGCVIRDSRKTLPGLRLVQKYAVRCGGGVNHRLGLGDAILIKDNHVASAGSVAAAVAAARRHAPGLVCEVEVDTLDQLDEALAAGPDLILLDNMDVDECASAVRRAQGTGVPLEASGGLTLDTAAAYAATGVDYLAIGALTHSSRALDIGLDLDPVEPLRHA